MKWWALLLCLLPSTAFAQATGTCDQYHPGIGGQFCVNNGTASGWKNLTGDVANVYNNGHCSPTDSSQCGKITVQGLQGSSFNGTISDGQGWCYQLSSNSYIPCSVGTNLASYTGAVGVTGTGSSGNPISNVSVNGVFNVIAYGAKGDNSTDDNPAITAAYAAACASASGPNNISLATVYLPKPSSCYRIAEPLLLSCGSPVQLAGDSDLTTAICAGNGFPMVVAVPSTYAAQSIGTISTTSLATGSGAAMNFASATPWYLNLGDAMSNFFGHAYPLNGLSQIDVRLFFNTGSLAHIQNMFWVGGNPTTTSSDQCGGAGLAAENALCVQTNGSVCYKLTTGGTAHSGCGAAGAVTTGTTHEAEMAYSGSNIYVFLDGTQISGSPFPATGTVTQTAYTDIIAGAPLQAYPDGGNSGTNFVGQMDSYQISNIARHTANYTADTTKFTSDGNTLLLINGTHFNNPLVGADTAESTSNEWMVARGFLGPQGAATSFRNLTFASGTIGIFQTLEPSPKYEDVSFNGLTWIGLELWNNTYEGRFSNLRFSMPSTSESAITAALAANAETFIAPQIILTGYHDVEGFDLSAHILNPFISPDQNSVDGFYDNCDNDFCGVSLLEPIDDVENGGSAIPLYLVGSGNYSVYSGLLRGGAGAPCVQVQGASGNKINLNIYGTTCNTTAPSPAELINFVGSNPLKTPVTWYSATANGLSYSAQTTIPWTNVPADLVVYGDVMQPPVKTVATLPTCNAAAKGQLTQISDCNANCTTYLGTTFTGGGSTRSTVQCNGTNWELH